MDFAVPRELQDYLAAIDRFVDAEIKPLQAQDDNERYFDHRREHARIDWDNGGLPRVEWEDLLREAKRRADKAGFLRFSLPKEFGGQDGSNLSMAVIREHLASQGLDLHNDLQNEHSVVGSFPFVMLMRDYGTPEQQKEFIDGAFDFSGRVTFGLTEPNHGSDATHMETSAVEETRNGVPGWLINGQKMWTTGMHHATHCAVFARTGGHDGDAKGISCILTPTNAEGVKVEEYLWTFNMPTDHPRVSFTNVWAPKTDTLGPEHDGLAIAQLFVHENRIRQAAGSLGAAVYCVNESVKYARLRKPFGQPLADNQAIQWPLVELATQCEMLRQLIRKPPGRWIRCSRPSTRPGSRTRSRCATTGPTAWFARRPTRRCRCMAAWAIRATSRSSTFIAITAATASPRARKKSRCAGWPASCSATWGRSGRRSRKWKPNTTPCAPGA
jgi:acyl-CoA dehydrogenase